MSIDMRCEKSAVVVVTDFLLEIYRWIINYLERRISAVVLDVTPMEFWFTVPAVWSDRAKSATLKAAERAAMNAKVLRKAEATTFLIAEPEAAAVATIAQITQGGSTQQIKVRYLRTTSSRRCCKWLTLAGSLETVYSFAIVVAEQW